MYLVINHDNTITCLHKYCSHLWLVRQEYGELCLRGRNIRFIAECLKTIFLSIKGQVGIRTR